VKEFGESHWFEKKGDGAKLVSSVHGANVLDGGKHDDL